MTLFSLFLFSFSLFADQEVSCAIHVHSAISSGAQSIPEIAKTARHEGVDVLIMTDLLAERYEYGLWPLRGLLKMTVKRHSVLEIGAVKYLEKIREANEKVPEVLTIDGVSATPFYYWSGNLWPGPLVLNHRGKDFLVIGLGDAKAYENLPVLGNGKSEFNPYDGDQFALPYQKLIDAVRKKSGIIFWSHPGASEHDDVSKTFFNMPVHLDTADYEPDLLSTSDYDGFGVDAVTLRDINSPNGTGAALPGRLWDRILKEYCEGKRGRPSWLIGEVDYNGVPGGNTYLGIFLNMLRVKEKSREEVLGAIRNGRLYVTITGDRSQRLLLKEFSVQDIRGPERVLAGGELALSAPAKIRVGLEFSDQSGLPVQVLLVRDGEVIQHWDAQTPFETEFQDTQIPSSQKSFYRLIASSPGNASLASNPIFTVSGHSRRVLSGNPNSPIPDKNIQG